MDGTPRSPRGAAAPWPAPAATGPVRSRLALPGSKSMTNRALVLAALADGPGTIVNPLRARDTLLAAHALTALGAVIEDAPAAGTPAAPGRGAGTRTGAATAPATPGPATPGPATPAWLVRPGRPAGDTRVDVGNAGTVMRFLPPVAALTEVAVEFHGDARASQRPVGPLLSALRELGATVDDGGRGAVPFTVRGAGSLPGGAVALDASASSQLISGLLLAAPRYDKGVEVRHLGPRVPSAPHLAMTVRMLRDAGAEVETGRRAGSGAGPDTWRVHPGVIRARTTAVEPDVSNAAPFLAAALVTGGAVTVADWPRPGIQPTGRVLDLLTAMGATCRTGPDGLTVTGGAAIGGLSADLGDVSELVPVLAALAALAASPSRLTGIGHMRRHETDRLAALAAELGALGAGVSELADGLEIRPRPLRATARPFHTYDDHRLVMAAAVLGLAVPGLTVENAGTAGKTFPGFTRVWAAMLDGAP